MLKIEKKSEICFLENLIRNMFFFYDDIIIVTSLVNKTQCICVLFSHQ